MNIPEQSVQLYRSIRAPETLEMKVQQNLHSPKKKSRMQTWGAVLASAACLALLLSVFGGAPTVDISVNGAVLGASPIAVTAAPSMLARGLPSPGAEAGPLIIGLKIPDASIHDISVTHGDVEAADGEAFSYRWTVETDSLAGKEASLTVKTNKKEVNYVLFANETGVWFLAKA